MDLTRPSRSNLAAGETHLLLELGQGGMGTVYLAVMRRPGGFSKLKVVKRLRADLGADEQFAQMFMEEARLAARLNHPNIVQTNEVGFDGHHYFLEMEYLEGQSLDALMRRARSRGKAPNVEVVWILAQALAGLHHAHELTDTSGRPLDVVHRDVSPHNIFVTYEGAVKVLDFGIAKAADSSVETHTGVVKGKIAYLSPEQAMRKDVDRRTDVFAVGIILWQSLAGKRLWGDLSDVDILERLQRDTVAPPSAEGMAVDPALEAICKRALARRAEDRYPTAAEFQQALEDWLGKSGGGVGARQVGVLVAELFEGRRTAIRAEIDSLLRKLEEGDATAVGIPKLQAAAAFQETRTDSKMPNASTDVGRRTTGSQRPTSLERGRAPAGLVPDATADPGMTKSTTGVASTAPAARAASRRRWVRGLGTLTGVATIGIAAGLVSRAVHRSTASSSSPVTSPRQCHAASDCRTLGARYLCGDRGECAVAEECVTNKECIDSHGGAPYVCRRTDGRCVNLRSNGCEPHAEPADLMNDETLWFGVLLRSADGQAANQEPFLNAVELARLDFGHVAGGIPSRSDHSMRPIGLVVCNPPPSDTSAARFLAADLRVPAVIGFPTSPEALQLLRAEFLPRKTLSMIAAGGASRLLTQVQPVEETPRLVWRTICDETSTAGGVAAYVGDVEEPAIRADRGLPADAKIRVALVRMSGESGLGFMSALYPTLRFNGRGVAENDTTFAELAYDSPAKGASPTYEAQIANLLKFEPDLVILQGPTQELYEIISGLEHAWRRRTRPYYILVGSLWGKALDLLKDPDLRHRLRGTSVSSLNVPNLQLASHYNEVFGTHLTPNDAPSSAYDALYVLAYASAAAEATGEPLTGESIARGIARLVPPGPTIDVGPANILSSLASLGRGERVNLNGSFSSLDFSTSTGEPAWDIVFTCARTIRNDSALTEMDSGLTYSPSTEHVSGIDRCR